MTDSTATASVDTSVSADISLLKQSTTHLENVLSSFEALASSSAPWKSLGYFDSKQHDIIEHLLFRFLVSRGVLVSLALQESEAGNEPASSSNNGSDNILQNALARAESSFADEGTSDETHTVRTRIIVTAAVSLFVYDARFVKIFRHDEIAIAKLNQQFYRSHIEADTYNTI